MIEYVIATASLDVARGELEAAAGARVRRLVLVPSLACLVPAVLATFDAIEWPEPCFAGAVALSACNTLSRLPRGRPGEKPG